MATSRDIVNSIEMTAHLGTVRAVQAIRRLERDWHGDSSVRFARDMAALPAPDKGPTPLHPDNARPAQQARSDQRRERLNSPRDGERQGAPRELSAADLVWLQRLPQDPTLVSHDEAARLAGLAAESAGLTPSSRNLVESIWQPIKELHDLAAAKHALEVASAPAPRIPASASGALVEAVQHEHRDWPDVAVRAHVQELLTQAIATRDAAHATKLAEARERVARLDRDAADRVARTREGAPA